MKEFKYEDFFNFSCPVQNLKHHQVLALNRGERQKVISIKIVFPDFLERKYREFCKQKYLNVGPQFDKTRIELITNAIQDSFTKYGIC